MNLRRLTKEDVAIGIAVLLLVFAAVRPMLTARGYRALVGQATEEVDVLREAALNTRRTTGNWPAATAEGEVPATLAPSYSGRVGFVFDDGYVVGHGYSAKASGT